MIGPDMAAMLGGGHAAPQAAPYITLPPNQPPDSGDAGDAGVAGGVLDDIRAALDAMTSAYEKDRDEEDKARYLKIAHQLQELLAKNQADMQDALGGGSSLMRLARKAG